MSDLISREEVLTAFADYVGSGMSMNDYDALWDIVAKIPPVKQEPTTDVLDKIRAEIEECKQYRGMTENPVIDKHNVGLDKYYDLGLEKAIKIIDRCKAESEG